MRSKKDITNWGNYPVKEANEFVFDSESHLKKVIESSPSVPFIARGAGRCYGDASLGENIVSTLHYTNILEFDTARGEIYCEAGVTLEELIEVILPKGYFLPVTPGTKFITVGGAVASPVSLELSVTIKFDDVLVLRVTVPYASALNHSRATVR